MRRIGIIAATALLALGRPAAADDASFLGFTAPVPEGWIVETPSSGMRQLQYRVPGEAGDGQFIVYYFGPGQGGSVEQNIARWQSQFTGPEGGRVEPEIERFEAEGMPVTVVELSGTYARSMGMGPGGDTKDDQTLLVGIVESGQGSLFAQLFGPAGTVEAAREGFDGFVHEIAPAAAP